MRTRHVILAIVAALLVVAILAPGGSTTPPPEGVCGICGPEFERAAEDNGVNATVTESSLTVEITADGDSHWTATATLNRDAAERFAGNRTLLYRTVGQSYSSYRTVVDDPENLSVALADPTVTATFTASDATHRYPGGVLLFDGFARYPPHGAPYINTDALTVEGPSGTAITHAPPGGTVSRNRAVWRPGDDRQRFDSPLGREATVAFAPDDGLLAQAVTVGAVRLHALGMIESELRAYATVPAALLALVATGLLLAGDRLPATLGEGRTVLRWLAAGGGLYAGLTAVVALAGNGVGVVLGVVGIGLIPQALSTATAAALADFVDEETDRNVPGMAVAAVAVWTLALLVGARAGGLLVLVAGQLVFLPFGILAAARHWGRFLFPFVAALGAVAAALPFVPRSGVVFVTPAMLLLLSIGTALLGTPLFAIGQRFGNASSS
ncbi:hypothetical protein [Halapricum desulfuricans]|uniref:hypothetical protein n=1 Tax=Halapricum desulfuricans TaxID=2841257 RepID=UPI001E2E12E6|nr:hypothetical protein [Halapricum desulfuricans]